MTATTAPSGLVGKSPPKQQPPGTLRSRTSRVSLSTRSPTRPVSPLKKEATPSPRLHVRPKKAPLASRDITISVKRIIGSSAKSHRELNGSVHAQHGAAMVYPAGATVVQCNLHEGRDPTYRYYCAPPDQDGMNELVNAVAAMNIATSTPPSASRTRFPNQAPRARASMGFDIHRGTSSPTQTSSPGGTIKGRSKSAKDRIRVLGCVALSPDQCWVAGGEKGYTPRVLIYSTATQNNTRTVAPKVQALLEHSDGIRCMAFSPCSRYLVSVGTVHDQCIIVYKLNSKNNWIKIAAAKFKDIIDSVIWSKRRIVTVGRRHLRVWEWHENSSSSDVFVLSNRSVLYSQLGEDAEFFAAAAIEGDLAVIASRPGFIYHLDTSTREIKLVTDVGREITCIVHDTSRSLLWIGGENGSLGAINSNFDGNVTYKGAQTEVYSEIVAISAFESQLLVIDATGQTHFLPYPELQANDPEHSPTMRQVNGAIKGLRVINDKNSLNATFFTWTGHRICFLDEQQCLKTIDLEDAGDEYDKVDCAVFCPKRGLLIIGDNYRTLRVIDIENEVEIWAEAIDSDLEEFDEGYDGSIMDLDVQTVGDKTYIISAWRDRSVMVHVGVDTWRLRHTLTHHRLGVNYLRFLGTKKFITSSLDRNVVLCQIGDDGESTEVQTYRSINLARAHAIDMQFSSDTTLVISTSDRQILTYDVTSGDLLHAYKTADSSELITLGNIGLSKTLTFPPFMKTKTLGSPVPQGAPRLRSLLAGAGNDKSIRIYDHETGTMLSTKWCHAESVTGLIFLPTSETSKTQQFVTAGTDGCVVIWDLEVPSKQAPPPRRFSPRSISQRFRKSMDDILRHE